MDADTHPSGPFLRGFIEGTASLFRIFHAPPKRRGTPEDDAMALMSDVEAIARDFHAVLPNIKANAPK